MKPATSFRSNGRALRQLAVTTFLVSTITGYALPTAADSFIISGSDYTSGTTNLVGQGPAAIGGAESFEVIPVNAADTDSDGLMVGPETGTFVSASDAGSNPLLIDTDGDTLRNGPEVNTYFTNPNLTVTDDDFQSDGQEVVQGSDPPDPASRLSHHLWHRIFPPNFLTGGGIVGFFPPRACRKAPVAQLDRASDYESEG